MLDFFMSFYRGATFLDTLPCHWVQLKVVRVVAAVSNCRMKNQSAKPHFCSDLQRLDDQEIDATTHF